MPLWRWTRDVVFVLTIAFLTTNLHAAEKGPVVTDQSRAVQTTNHLAGENSPYLLSHAHNPVDWYPWGEEALAKARNENKPIFLSIGYSACHWCHVMERESFEDSTVAQLLNDNFVSIKVDREQRPDLDHLYMSFTTAMTGSGGWPMSVFLTPDLKPFFAGTYFPREDMYGRPGFIRVVTELGMAWRDERISLVTSANDIFAQINSRYNRPEEISILRKEMIDSSARALMRNFDDVYGGFGAAPKFPHAIELSLFLLYSKRTGDLSFREASEKALKAMARGGIYDQIGGGFARYSTDRQWLVPHFEKMLYDNALLVPTYADAFLITGDPLYRRIVVESLDFILNEMTDSFGGFYSALDADSEGKEGEFYVWTKTEIESVLGTDADFFCQYYNVADSGNFEGKSILFVSKVSDRMRVDPANGDTDSRLAACHKKLLAVRNTRVHPSTDDKTLTSWNGLALTAFCRGYQISGEQRFLNAALANARFVLGELDKGGKLTHAYRKGIHSDGEFLEDYAFYIRSLLDLYETDMSAENHKWIEAAANLTERAIKLFMDDSGAIYLRPAQQSDLIMRPKEETDGAIPSAGSYLIQSLLRLGRMLDRPDFTLAAEKALRAIAGRIEAYPGGMASAILALDYYFSDKIEIVVIGDGDEAGNMVHSAWRTYIPNRILAYSQGNGGGLPLFLGRSVSVGKAVGFVCRNATCRLPVSSASELVKQLREL
jgi:uncharacterized protein